MLFMRTSLVFKVLHSRLDRSREENITMYCLILTYISNYCILLQWVVSYLRWNYEKCLADHQRMRSCRVIWRVPMEIA